MSNGLKQKIKSVVKYLGLLFVLALPFAARAQTGIEKGLDDVSDLFSHTGISGSTTLTGRFGLIESAIILLLGLAFGLAVLFLIIGGFYYITSAGNEEQAEKGKKTLINAIIGIALIILSYAIVRVISNFVSQ